MSTPSEIVSILGDEPAAQRRYDYEKSWWRDTPWARIREEVRMSISRAEFDRWLKRSDVIERSKHAP